MVHQYKLGGYCIVVDVYSGAIHVVDEVAYDIIAMFEHADEDTVIAEMLKKHGDKEDVNEQELRACYADIAALKAQGKLFHEDSFGHMADTLKEKTSGVVKALCLHVAHTCNLNCAYCFASQGKYAGERALMSYETGKQALDFLIANSGSRHNLEVDFFRGEPLMNFDMVKQLVAYAREREKE
jgi:uncharacterized protein